MTRRALAGLLVVVSCCAGGFATAQQTVLYRCNAQGRTTFQQQPCPANSSEAQVRVVPAGGSADAAPAPPPRTTSSDPPATAPEAPPAVTLSPLEQEAEQCLDHLRAFLLDPRSAYATGPSRDGRVLSMTVHATNLRGGVSAKRAACEMFNGAVDASWTRIHLQRLGWFARRAVAVRTGGHRVLVPDGDTIEVPQR